MHRESITQSEPKQPKSELTYSPSRPFPQQRSIPPTIPSSHRLSSLHLPPPTVLFLHHTHFPPPHLRTRLVFTCPSLCPRSLPVPRRRGRGGLPLLPRRLPLRPDPLDGRLVFESVVCVVWLALARYERLSWHGCNKPGRRGGGRKRRDDGLSEEAKAQMLQELLERVFFERMIRAERERVEEMTVGSRQEEGEEEGTSRRRGRLGRRRGRRDAEGIVDVLTCFSRQCQLSLDATLSSRSLGSGENKRVGIHSTSRSSTRRPNAPRSPFSFSFLLSQLSLFIFYFFYISPIESLI